MDASRAKLSRDITAVEVCQWVGESKFKLTPAQYDEIATRLNQLHWPSDPPAPPPWSEDEADTNRWWDPEAVPAAAKLLLDSIPLMLSHWERLRKLPETRGGFDAISELQDSLSTALPYIEWPCGQYDRNASKMRLEAWHSMAQCVARLVIKVIVEGGYDNPGITRNSVVVRMVRNALIRMNFPNAKMITTDAIGAYFTRWEKMFGPIPRSIASLTTK